MDTWHIDLDRESGSAGHGLCDAVLGNVVSMPGNPEVLQNGTTIVLDGYCRSDVPHHSTETDTLDARWHIVIDAPRHSRGVSALAERQICAALQKWRGDSLGQTILAIAEHLEPEFAFALIDKARGLLALVRDPIGSRPLYWRRTKHRISFSSSRENLLDATADAGIDPAAVAVFLGTGGGVWSTTEFLAGFHRVPHGGFTLFSHESVKTGQWWTPELANREPPRQDNAATARDVRTLVEHAVAERIRPEQPTAAHVSGGVDSTGVAAIGARQIAKAGGRLVAAYAWSPPFSDMFPDLGRHDERRRIEAFAEREGVQARFGGASAPDLVAFLARPIELEGTADLADEMPILKMALADGVKTMLSGWGGDEVFSNHGSGYLSYLLSTAQWDKAARWMRSRLRSLRRIGPAAAMLWWEGIRPMLPDFLHNLFDPAGLSGAQSSLLAPGLMREYRERIIADGHRFRRTSRPSETMFRHFMAGHISQRMESWDVWSKQYGFRYTYPLSDRKLVEHLLALPPELHYPTETPRGLALHAFADVLPAGVSKYDAANEAARQKTRTGAWQILAEMERNGAFKSDCPWIDMQRFRDRLANPVNQASTEGVMAFLHLFTACRIWYLWMRQAQIN